MKTLAKALVILALTLSVTLVVGTVTPIVLVPPEPPEPPKPNDTLIVEAETVPDLTEEEREMVMNIIKSDINVSRILEKGNWTVPLMGPWTDGNGTERLGAVALIKFNGHYHIAPFQRVIFIISTEKKKPSITLGIRRCTKSNSSNTFLIKV